jgi:tRNA (guanine-N7-)-methyltransferase
VREIHLYHPQPYRDAEKKYRRLVTPEFLALVVRSLEPAGQFVIQTDNPAYWEYIRTIAPAFFELHIQPGPWPDDPQGRTRREIMARGMKLKIFRAWGSPRLNLAPEQIAELVRNLPQPDFEVSPEDSEPRRRGRRGNSNRRRR